jgi:hypothetical protein
VVTRVEHIVVYQVWHGPADEGDCRFGSYAGPVVYAEWDDAARDIRAALDNDRRVMIDAVLMTQAEYDDEFEASAPGHNPLLQDA